MLLNRACFADLKWMLNQDLRIAKPSSQRICAFVPLYGVFSMFMFTTQTKTTHKNVGPFLLLFFYVWAYIEVPQNRDQQPNDMPTDVACLQVIRSLLNHM